MATAKGTNACDRSAALPSDNCRFQTGGSFLDDLANADLLVSYCSTTIEEALQARRPVLMWGGTRRYSHLPARETVPSPGSRAAVYRAASEADLVSGVVFLSTLVSLGTIPLLLHLLGA